MCSVSMAATSLHVSVRSVSESSDELAILELEAVVELVRYVDVWDPAVEDELRVPDVPLEELLDPGNDPRIRPTLRGRRYSHSSSMTSWQRIHSEPASSISLLHTWYCRSRKRTASQVSLCSHSRSFKRTWVKSWGGTFERSIGYPVY